MLPPKMAAPLGRQRFTRRLPSIATDSRCGAPEMGTQQLEMQKHIPWIPEIYNDGAGTPIA